MPEPKKKPGGLAALIMAKPEGDRPYGEPDGDEATGYGEEDNRGASFDAAAESLMRQLNIPEGHRDEFKTSLKETIHACVRGYSDEG